MIKNKLESFDFSDINTEGSYVIKNFILSNSNEKPIDINLKHPFSFKGIVFIICLKGSGSIKIDFKEYSIKENSILTILPNQITENVKHSDDFFIELLGFSFDFLSDIPLPKDFNLPQRIARNPMLEISNKEVQNLLRYHSFIIDTFNNARSFLFEQIIKGLLYSLLMEIVVLYTEQGNEVDKDKTSLRSEEIVMQFMELLKDHYKDGRLSSYYADKLCITPKYLSSTLKKVTGRSINSWIEDAVLIGAKILLKSTNLTVLQISEELNFPNSSYFGRFFKKHAGITPKSYRDS